MYSLSGGIFMAIKPNKVRGLRGLRQRDPVGRWERAIDVFLSAGKYHRVETNPHEIRFNSTEVRRFVHKDLPRLDRSIQDQLEVRYKNAEWADVHVGGGHFYFRIAPKA